MPVKGKTVNKLPRTMIGTYIQQNLVDLVWGKDRPSRPSEKVQVHPIKYAGKTFQDKVADLRKELETKKKAGFIICTRPLIAVLIGSANDE